MLIFHFESLKVEDPGRGRALAEGEEIGVESNEPPSSGSDLCVRRRTFRIRFDMLFDLRGLDWRSGRSRLPVMLSTLEKASATSRTISTPPMKVFLSVSIKPGTDTPGDGGECSSRPVGPYSSTVGSRVIAESPRTLTVFGVINEWEEGTLLMPKPSGGVHLRPESTIKLFVTWTGSCTDVTREL